MMNIFKRNRILVSNIVEKKFLNLSRKSSFSIRNFRNHNEYIIPTIIGTNIFVFCIWKIGESDRRIRNFMMDNFTLCPNQVARKGYVHTLLTCVFSHMEIWHLFGNMFTLYFFGSPSLAILGANNFLKLYVGSGFISSLSFVLWSYSDFRRDYYSRLKKRNEQYSYALGASGAINSIVIWNICTFRRSLVYIYGVIPIPAMLFGNIS